MRNTYLICGMAVLLVWLWFVGTVFGAAGEKLSTKGYNFDISADQTAEGLNVRGRVSGGDRCKKLSIKITFYNENNENVKVVAIVNNYGGNKRFGLKKKISRSGLRWRVSKISVTKYK